MIPSERRLLFELLAATGLRISEALGLDWGDVAFGGRPVLHVPAFQRRLEARPSSVVLPSSPA